MSDPVPSPPDDAKDRPATGRRTRYPLVLLVLLGLIFPFVKNHLPPWFPDDRFDKEVAKAVEAALRAELGDRPLPALKREAAEILPTGLDTDRLREAWHRTPEGSDVFPVALFQALDDPSTGRPLIESMERFGFVASPIDDTGLPVGFTRLLSKNGDFVMTGINCAACHSSRITHKGRSLHVDGAPNLIDVEAFFRGVLAAAEGLMKPGRDEYRLKFLLKFAYFNSLELDRFRRSGAGDAGYGSPGAAAPPSLMPHERAEQSLEFLLQQLRSAARIVASFEQQTPAGPGRADSFGIIRNLLMTPELVGGNGNFRPMTAPVSVPHLFGFASFTNLHWDGNTTTGTDRNYAQAIALGANLDPKTMASSTRPHGLYQVETAAWKLTPPRWPESVFGPINRVRAARGRELFRSQACVDCHAGETWTRLEVLGTDPNRLLNYNDPIDMGSGRTESYATNLHRLTVAVKQKAYADNNVSAADQKRMDTWHEGVPPMWIDTREKGYFTRPLRGLWATAPFLHNGSVPTLWDLLQPAAKRPARFPVGHREFDPNKVGYVERPAKVVWEFDTSISGNRNTGHEYGTGLSDEQKWDLVEYLKTL